MGRFLRKISMSLLMPLFLLAVVYFVTDPYKTLRPFSLTYFDSTNRDYLSSELFILNYPDYQYDSYVFGSSRACGVNSYHWLKYLPEGSRQFVFQAWSETITGIDQKVSFMDEHQYTMQNVLVLLDMPGTFSKPQLPTQAMSVKNPRFSHQPKWIYQLILFSDFLQKPSEWIRAVKHYVHSPLSVIGFDTVSNDWDKGNRDLNVACLPEQDSLRNLSRTARAAFFKNYVDNPWAVAPAAQPIIGEKEIRTMRHIMEVFERHGTDYRIMITPGYYYKYPAVAGQDLEIIQQVFGKDHVFDFSGRQDMTKDYNSFADPNHFGLRIGWKMIEEVYNQEK